jgi:hypothetical protein
MYSESEQQVAHHRGAVVDTLLCPQCGGPAAAEWSAQLDCSGSTITHVKVRCLDRHWFLLPADRLQVRASTFS